MILLATAYLGGVLTILSPSILPILPFAFARSDQPFIRSTLPMLVSMAAAFALAATGGSWAVQANKYGRYAAMVLLAILGLILLSPQAATGQGPSLKGRLGSGKILDYLTQPTAGSLVLGIATGLLWAPCAGPILNLLLTDGAGQANDLHATPLLLVYAAGAATSLAILLLVGGRILGRLRRSSETRERVRKGMGIAILASVAAIAVGLDTSFLARLSYQSTSALDQVVLDRLDHTAPSVPQKETASNDATLPIADEHSPFRSDLSVQGRFPSLDGAVEWLNSPPLTPEQLRGKVVLVDFWTYSCIDCVQTIPHLREWAEKYRAQGLVIIGVHAPEFAFEKRIGNVRKAVSSYQIGFPVAIDNDYRIWRSFSNTYWPEQYFFDATGQLRYHHLGQGDYENSEKAIQDLLREANSGS